MFQHLGFFEEYRLPVWTFLWCSLPSNVMVFRQCNLNQVSGHNKPMSAAHHHTQHHTLAQHDSWSPPASCKWFVPSKPLRWARSRVSLSKWVLPKLNAGIDMLWVIGYLLEGPRPGWNKNAYESICHVHCIYMHLIDYFWANCLWICFMFIFCFGVASHLQK